MKTFIAGTINILIFLILISCSKDETIEPVNKPTNLTISAVTAGQISLSWIDNADNENGFIIERAINDSTLFTQIASIAKDKTTYQNINLASNTYFYRIKAFSRNNSSDYSNMVKYELNNVLYKSRSIK